MKKKSEKKLSLGKIKLTSLTKPDQQVLNGGYYSKLSVCPFNQCTRQQ